MEATGSMTKAVAPAVLGDPREPPRHGRVLSETASNRLSLARREKREVIEHTRSHIQRVFLRVYAMGEASDNKTSTESSAKAHWISPKQRGPTHRCGGGREKVIHNKGRCPGCTRKGKPCPLQLGRASRARLRHQSQASCDRRRHLSDGLHQADYGGVTDGDQSSGTPGARGEHAADRRGLESLPWHGPRPFAQGGHGARERTDEGGRKRAHLRPSRQGGGPYEPYNPVERSKTEDGQGSGEINRLICGETGHVRRHCSSPEDTSGRAKGDSSAQRFQAPHRGRASPGTGARKPTARPWPEHPPAMSEGEPCSSAVRRR